MLRTERQKKICTKYRERDENGKVHCFECPLVINPKACECRAWMHWDRHTQEWVEDGWGNLEPEKEQ